MTKRVNIAFVGIPAVATSFALWRAASGDIRSSDLIALVSMYTLTTVGITVGFHRLLTHKSFKARKSVRVMLAILGSMAVENPVIIWVADHRCHHAYADREGDPHSPQPRDKRLFSKARALAHAHVGWLLDTDRRADPIRYAPDLLREPAMRRVSRAFVPLVFAGIIAPLGIGFLLSGTRAGALSACLWGGPVRIFLQQQMTFSVNSICHTSGVRRFAAADKSANVFWLAIPSLGDSWHHNHHTFPRSARHGLALREVDLSWLLIRLLVALRLASDVVSVDRDQQAQRTAPVGVPSQIV